METLPKIQPCDNVINRIDEYREIAPYLTVDKIETQNSVDAFAEHYLPERFGEEYGKRMYADLHSTTYSIEEIDSCEHMAINIKFLHENRYGPISLYVSLEELGTGHASVVIMEEQGDKLIFRPGRDLSTDEVRGIALDLHDYINSD